MAEAVMSFEPNRLNVVFHDDLEPINVPARDIGNVRHEFGLVNHAQR
jgi:hypothetical protein